MRVCRMTVPASTQAPPSGNLLEPAGLSLADLQHWLGVSLWRTRKAGFSPSLSYIQRASRQTFYPSAQVTAGQGCSAGLQRPTWRRSSLHSTAGPERLPGLRVEAQAPWAGLMVYEFQEFINNELSILRLLESPRYLNGSGTRSWGHEGLGCKAAFQGMSWEGPGQGCSDLHPGQTHSPLAWAWTSEDEAERALGHYVLETAI